MCVWRKGKGKGKGEGVRVEERGEDRVEAEGVLELDGPDGLGGVGGSNRAHNEERNKRNDGSTDHDFEIRDRLHRGHHACPDGPERVYVVLWV